MSPPGPQTYFSVEEGRALIEEWVKDQPWAREDDYKHFIQISSSLPADFDGDGISTDVYGIAHVEFYETEAGWIDPHHENLFLFLMRNNGADNWTTRLLQCNGQPVTRESFVQASRDKSSCTLIIGEPHNYSVFNIQEVDPLQIGAELVHTKRGGNITFLNIPKLFENGS